MEEAKEIVENALQTGNSTIDLSSLELEALAPEILSEALCFVTVLNLDYNDLSCLPSEISLLSSLEVLSASGNHLRDLPQTLQELKKLESLHLNENCFGELPVLLSKIPMLRILNLVGNGIEIWNSELGESLVELRLDENKLKTLPRSFCHMKNLKILELGDNNITGLPEDVGNLNQLEILNLSQNDISKLPSSFGNLPRIKSLDLSGNNIEDLPDSFQSAEIIENLFIEKNSLKSLPPWFESLHSIVNLSLSDNQLLGSPLPDCFGSVSGKSLKTLDLSANSISQLPSTIGELQSLEKLKLGSTIDELERRAFQNGNWLCMLPSNFGWMTCLKKLHLDENQLVELPENFGLLQNLEWVDLGQNRIQNLPQSFCSLSKLWFLQLSQNYLKVLPDNFGNLSSLIELRLNNNYLTELPSSFANLSNLQTLDLFHNELSKIPEELVSLKKLLRLDLDKNKFKLKASKVPKLTKQVKYPEKDPNFKDNWRGKMREDYIEPEEVKTVGILKEVCDDSEEDEPDEEASYSEEALKFAMNRSLSIWKSHEGSDQREVDKQRDEGAPVPNLNSVLYKQPEEAVIDSSKNLYNEIFEDAEDCTPVENHAGLSLPDEVNETLSNGASQSEDSAEDWDKEIQSAQAYDLMLDMFKQRRQYSICLQNQLHNLLCSYPPASQAFTKSANYESAVYSLPLYHSDAKLTVSLDSGQFDDADEDQES